MYWIENVNWKKATQKMSTKRISTRKTEIKNYLKSDNSKSYNSNGWHYMCNNTSLVSTKIALAKNANS
jgi:hypothetical protein